MTPQRASFIWIEASRRLELRDTLSVESKVFHSSYCAGLIPSSSSSVRGFRAIPAAIAGVILIVE